MERTPLKSVSAVLREVRVTASNTFVLVPDIIGALDSIYVWAEVRKLTWGRKRVN